MKSNPLYKQIKQIALDEDYTIQQVRDATKTQITSLLGISESAVLDTFVDCMKANLAEELRRRDFERDKQFIIDNYSEELRKRFGDCQIDKSEIRGYRCVLIWLDGAPPEPEDED